MEKKNQSSSSNTTSRAKEGKKCNLHARKPINETCKNWRDLIRYSDLNVDNFLSETVMIVESTPKCFPILDGVIAEATITDQSKILLISYDNIYKLVYGHISMKHFSKFIVTSLKKAISEAKAEIKAKNAISPELLALLVKIQMFILRDKYVSHKENYYLLQKVISIEQDALLPTLTSDQSSKKAPKGKPKNVNTKKDIKNKAKEKSKPSGARWDELNKDTQYPTSDEIKRKMKSLKQSEEFIEPYEGTDLYFVLTKLYDQELLVALYDIGIPTVALIDMAIDESGFSTTVSHDTIFETSNATYARRLDISNFWRAYGLADGDQQFSIPPKMCYLRYCPPNATSNYTLVYNDLVRIVQNITDLKRQHTNYLNNMNLLNFNEDKTPTKIQRMQTYNRILSHVPNECQSVPVILHALIEEVSERVSNGLLVVSPYSLDTAKNFKNTKKYKRAQEQFLNIFTIRKQGDNNKVDQNTNAALYKTISIPYGNVINYMVSHTSYSEDLKTINVESLKSIMPLTLFKNYLKVNFSDSLEYNYLFHKWSNNFKDITINQLKHCVHSYLFKHGSFHKGVITLTNKPIGAVQDLLFSELKPFNHKSERKPEVCLKFLMSSFIRKGLKESKISPQISHPLDYCEHLEEYDRPTMLQMINTAYDNMKCFDYKLFSPHDAMLLHFYPGHTEMKHGKSFAIRTGVCFRDFCAFIIPEEIDWLLANEKKYWETKSTEAEMKNQGLLQDEKFEKQLAWEKSIDATLQIKPMCPKQYSYEGYDLSSDYYALQHSTTKFSSVDGISVTMDKQHWTNDKKYCSVKLSIGDNHLIFHCLQKKMISASRPFLFHLNLSNGVIMAFSSPLNEKKSIYQRGKCVLMYEHTKADSIRQRSRRSRIIQKTRCNHVEPTMSSLQDNKYLETKSMIINKIRQAARTKIPTFKICSSRLHKYHYVKRIKSQIEIQIGKLIKRFVLRSKMHIQRKRQLLVSHCVPALDTNKSRITPDFFWKTTLPTGLRIQSVSGTEQDPMYIKQGYIINRSDISTIQDEKYRIFLRGRVLSFRKTGDILSMAFNRSIGLHHYGYFSSNIFETNTRVEQLRGNIYLPSLHKISKDVPHIERKIQKIYKKYRRHLIDSSENYRLYSKREWLRNERKTYRMTKKLYSNAPSLSPLIKCKMVIGDGVKYSADGTKIIKKENKYYSKTYNDYLKGETLIYRQDGTSWFLDNKGYATTQFPDNTRITTWASVLDENFLLNSDDLETFMSLDTMNTSFDTGSDRFSRIIALDSVSVPRVGSCAKVQHLDGGTLLDDSCQYLFKRSMVDDTSFVLIGMNYKYEHPNYMPVTEKCVDASITVELPDGFSTTTFKEGSYRVNLQNGENIDINKKYVNLQTDSCVSCHEKTKCKINMYPLYSTMKKTKTEPRDIFLYMEDKKKKVIKIDFSGNLTEKFETQDLLCRECDSDKLVVDRYFVLNRDLTGTELFIRPKPNRFICTLTNFDGPPKTDSCNITRYNCTCTMQQVFKTYSEHLMMLYDTPIFGFGNYITESEEIFSKLDYDRRNFVKLKAPRFLYERTIYHLSFPRVIESLAVGFYNYLNSEEKETVFQPTSSLVQFITENPTPEIILSAVIPPVQTITEVSYPYVSKFKWSKKLLRNQTKLEYFDVEKELIFQILHDCVGNALDIVENKVINNGNFYEEFNTGGDVILQSIDKDTSDITNPFVSEEFELSTVSEVSKSLLCTTSDISYSVCDHSTYINSKAQSDYDLKIPRPDIQADIIMHLKPNCLVRDIFLTAKTIKIIGDKNFNEVLIPKHDQQQRGFDIKGNCTFSTRRDTDEQKHSSTKDKFDILNRFKPYEVKKCAESENCRISGNKNMSVSYQRFSSQTPRGFSTKAMNTYKKLKDKCGKKKNPSSTIHNSKVAPEGTLHESLSHLSFSSGSNLSQSCLRNNKVWLSPPPSTIKQKIMPLNHARPRSRAYKHYSITGLNPQASKVRCPNVDTQINKNSRLLKNHVYLNNQFRLSAGINDNDDFASNHSHPKHGPIQKIRLRGSRSSGEVEGQNCVHAKLEDNGKGSSIFGNVMPMLNKPMQKFKPAIVTRRTPFHSLTSDINHPSEEKLINRGVQTGISLSTLRQETFAITTSDIHQLASVDAFHIKDGKHTIQGDIDGVQEAFSSLEMNVSNMMSTEMENPAKDIIFSMKNSKEMVDYGLQTNVSRDKLSGEYGINTQEKSSISNLYPNKTDQIMLRQGKTSSLKSTSNFTGDFNLINLSQEIITPLQSIRPESSNEITVNMFHENIKRLSGLKNLNTSVENSSTEGFLTKVDYRKSANRKGTDFKKDPCHKNVDSTYLNDEYRYISSELYTKPLHRKISCQDEIIVIKSPPKNSDFFKSSSSDDEISISQDEIRRKRIPSEYRAFLSKHKRHPRFMKVAPIKCSRFQSSESNTSNSDEFRIETKNNPYNERKNPKKDKTRSKDTNYHDRKVQHQDETAVVGTNPTNEPAKCYITEPPRFCNMYLAKEKAKPINPCENKTKLRSALYAEKMRKTNAIDASRNDPVIKFLPPPTIKDPQGYYTNVTELKNTTYGNNNKPWSRSYAHWHTLIGSQVFPFHKSNYISRADNTTPNTTESMSTATNTSHEYKPQISISYDGKLQPSRPSLLSAHSDMDISILHRNKAKFSTTYNVRTQPKNLYQQTSERNKEKYIEDHKHTFEESNRSNCQLTSIKTEHVDEARSISNAYEINIKPMIIQHAHWNIQKESMNVSTEKTNRDCQSKCKTFRRKVFKERVLPNLSPQYKLNQNLKYDLDAGNPKRIVTVIKPKSLEQHLESNLSGSTQESHPTGLKIDSPIHSQSSTDPDDYQVPDDFKDSDLN